MPDGEDNGAATTMHHNIADIAEAISHGGATVSHETIASAAKPIIDPSDLPSVGISASELGSFAGHHGFASASSDDYYEVKTEVLRERAEAGRAAIQELEDLIQSSAELVAASEGYWTGAAADYFREQVASGLKAFKQNLDNIADYPRELLSYADEYDGVITETEMIAESVSGVEYQEV